MFFADVFLLSMLSIALFGVFPFIEARFEGLSKIVRFMAIMVWTISFVLPALFACKFLYDDVIDLFQPLILPAMIVNIAIMASVALLSLTVLCWVLMSILLPYKIPLKR